MSSAQAPRFVPFTRFRAEMEAPRLADYAG
jgi:hypothetical protein